MKKSKAFLSLFSIILSSILMFSVFSSDIFNDTATADVTINGVSGKLQEFGEDILNIFYDEKNENNSKKLNNTEYPKVYLGGYPIGLKLYADGVVIVGTEAVDTENGLVNTAENAGLQVGDIIKKVNNIEVNRNSQVSEIIEKSAGEEVVIVAQRDGEEFTVNFKAEFSVADRKYKAGIWIRDSSAGIGTVTFCTQEGFFASLGHAVCDIDTKTTIPISQGECTEAKITGYTKGTSGTAGELCGFLESERTGAVYSNESIGVYGEFDSLPSYSQLFEIADSSEIVTGDAEIYTTLENGVIEKYTVKIEKIDANSEDHKNLVLKVTDSTLIEKTGGIIQGMSGSPIIQNGKIIGAVTHVFLNDPTGGFGIFAETMYDNLCLISQDTQ